TYPRIVSFIIITTPPPSRSTLFPYTTLFRSNNGRQRRAAEPRGAGHARRRRGRRRPVGAGHAGRGRPLLRGQAHGPGDLRPHDGDRKSTRLNSSHVKISYDVFCLKKKIQVIK